MKKSQTKLKSNRLKVAAPSPMLLQEIGRYVLIAADNDRLLIDTAGPGIAAADHLERLGVKFTRARKIGQLHWIRA